MQITGGRAALDSLKGEATRLREENERLEQQGKQMEKEIQQLKSQGTQAQVQAVAVRLSEKLAENAIDVYRQSTVGDNVERIVATLKEAASRADILITSGGLGPTADDVTLEALSKFVSRPLVLHHPTYRYIVSRLKSRGFSMTKLITKQCRVPQGAGIIQNNFGTAPGPQEICRDPSAAPAPDRPFRHRSRQPLPSPTSTAHLRRFPPSEHRDRTKQRCCPVGLKEKGPATSHLSEDCRSTSAVIHAPPIPARGR